MFSVSSQYDPQVLQKYDLTSREVFGHFTLKLPKMLLIGSITELSLSITIASGLHCIKSCRLVSQSNGIRTGRILPRSRCLYRHAQGKYLYLSRVQLHINSFITSLGVDLSQVDHFSVATFVQPRDTKSRDCRCAGGSRQRSTCFTCRNLNLIAILISKYDQHTSHHHIRDEHRLNMCLLFAGSMTHTQLLPGPNIHWLI